VPAGADPVRVAVSVCGCGNWGVIVFRLPFEV
jgi:hypothetical protein